MGYSMMLRKRYSPVGLDFADKTIRAVQLRQEKRSVTLSNYKIVHVPDGCLQAGIIQDPEELKNILSELVKSETFKGRTVNFNISAQQVHFRTIILPRLTPQELAEAIYWEADKYLEGSLEDPVVDYLTLGEKEDAGRTVLEVLLLASSRKVVEGYVKLLDSAGLEPLSLEIKPVSLFRLMKQIYPLSQKHFEKECLMTLDIGDEGTTLIIMDEGKLLFARNINFGRDYIMNKIMESNGKGMPPEGQFAEDEVLVAAAEALLVEVERSLEYFTYYMENREKVVRHLCFTGTGSRMHGLTSFLSMNLNMESHHADLFSFLDFTGQLKKEEIAEDAFQLAVALGSSLRQWPAGK
ncbi:MAG: type IV pilus assembly protein PilM [Dethiobacter sp.]|jgi:type IV pilus assembly protein PilM|nr:MAG: type IV pilus assembly protein PilM [Dethiobacter sp.]